MCNNNRENGLPLLWLDSSKASVLDKLRTENGHNIILGADYIGEKILRATDYFGISISAFAQIRTPEEGRFFCERPLLSYSAAIEAYPAANIFVTHRNVASTSEKLAKRGAKQAYSINIIDLLPSEKPKAFSKERALYLNCRYTSAYQKGLALYPKELHSGFWIELPITSRCTLRCRDCIFFMPSYTSPRHEPVEKILATIDALSETFDFISGICVLGGEPIFHPEFHLIVQHALKKSNIGEVAIITNGTLLPSEEQWEVLHNERACLIISDYGELSVKRDELVKKAKTHNVDGYVTQFQLQSGWVNARLFPHPFCDGVSPQERALRCNFRGTCQAVIDNKLYPCEMAAHAADLSLIPDAPGNYVSLTKDVNRASWGEFLYGTPGIPACEYCTGLPSKSAKMVPVAVQI